MSFSDKIFGTYSERQIKKINKTVDKIESLAPIYAEMSNSELSSVTTLLKERLANGETLDDILPDAFAAIREADDRVLGKRPFKVQLMGGTYRFYNIMALFFVFATAFLLRDFGPMLKAEVRARTTGATINPGSEVMETEKVVDEEKEEIKENYGILKTSKKVTPPNIWNALIPVGVLIISAVVLFYTNGAAAVGAEALEGLSFFEAVREAYSNSDASIVLFQAGLLACIVAIIMGFFEKIFTLKDGIETWAHGMKSMLFVCIVLILAWSIGSVIGDLGTAHFLVSNLSDVLPQFIVPALIFIIAAVVSFATGTAYGTMAILLPLCIPLAAAIVGITGMEITSSGSAYAYILMCSSAVLTGAIFGDHSSPISDTSILSSMGAGCSLIDHVMTQIVYAVTVGVVVIAGYILVGLGLNVWITLLIMAVILVLVLLFAGKKVPTWDGKETAE